MRRVTKMFVVALLVGALAVPVVAWSHGRGRGRHMMGPWGSTPEYGWGYERGYGDVTKEQRSNLEELDRRFYNETGELRGEIWKKTAEFNALLSNPNPDANKVKALQRELSELRSTMDEKRLAYDLEARKILPESSGGYGMGYGGHHMGGYGAGMGSGIGGCWR